MNEHQQTKIAHAHAQIGDAKHTTFEHSDKKTVDPKDICNMQIHIKKCHQWEIDMDDQHEANHKQSNLEQNDNPVEPSPCTTRTNMVNTMQLSKLQKLSPAQCNTKTTVNSNTQTHQKSKSLRMNNL